jgi:hypothetical protein
MLSKLRVMEDMHPENAPGEQVGNSQNEMGPERR